MSRSLPRRDILKPPLPVAFPWQVPRLQPAFAITACTSLRKEISAARTQDNIAAKNVAASRAQGRCRKRLSMWGSNAIFRRLLPAGAVPEGVEDQSSCGILSYA